MSQHDPVSIIAKAIQMEIPNSVLESTRSELRGLAFQHSHRTLGKIDNDLRRASCLIEFVAREKEGIKIPIAKLAKVSYTKEREFQKFYQLIGNLRRSQPTSNNNHFQVTKASSSLSSNSSFSSLAMKLGSYLLDANGVALRAQRLFGKISRFRRKDRHQMKDMVDHARAYEAVCFFIVATQDVGKEDLEEKPLQVSNIVDVSKDFTLTEFANIEAHVRGIIADMTEKENNDENAKKKYVPSNASSSGTTQNKKRSLTNASHKDLQEETKPKERSTKRSKQAAAHILGYVEDREKDINAIEDSNDRLLKDARSFVMPTRDATYHPAFVVWREKVINQSIQEAMHALEEQASENEVSTTISRERALQWAACDILRRHGFSSS